MGTIYFCFILTEVFFLHYYWFVKQKCLIANVLAKHLRIFVTHSHKYWIDFNENENQNNKINMLYIIKILCEFYETLQCQVGKKFTFWHGGFEWECTYWPWLPSPQGTEYLPQLGIELMTLRFIHSQFLNHCTILVYHHHNHISLRFTKLTSPAPSKPCSHNLNQVVASS